MTQKNLKNGVYGTGQLHPEKENGVLCKSRSGVKKRAAKCDLDYQNLTKEFVVTHLEAEKATDRQIFPAFAGLNTMNEEGKETDKSKSANLREQNANSSQFADSLNVGLMEVMF